jgi:uracil-DNA glycosylase
MSLLEKLKVEVSKCVRCPELAKCRTQTVFGDGNPKSRVLMVGEAPGADEDREGIPFVGQAGQFLSRSLEEQGITRANYYIANMLKCRPPANRDPNPDEISNCKGYLAAQITLLKPKIIITLGRFSMEDLINKKYKISEVHGKPIRSKDGVLFFPMFHPSATLHQPKYREPFLLDVKKLKKLFGREGLI